MLGCDNFTMMRVTTIREFRNYKILWTTFLLMSGGLLVALLFFIKGNSYQHYSVETLYTNFGHKFPNYSILKSCRRDRRAYRFTEMPNGLRVVVISDRRKFRSSVALNVATGSVHDPLSHMGLAHLLEHVLFHGTKKYPSSNAFSNFIRAHGGLRNARTTFVDTTFYYKIPFQYLKQSLDMFSQFFISALLDENIVKREISLVNEEHLVSKHNDIRKLELLMRYVSNRNHSLFKFSCGNIDTLNKTDIQEQVMKFYHEKYSANLVSHQRMQVYMY